MHLAKILLMIAAAILTRSAYAELLYYDPFLTGSNPAAGEYTVGLVDPTANPGDGQNPTVGPTPFLTGPWEVPGALAINASVQEAGLSFLGAPALGGSQISTPDAGGLRRLLSSPWTESTTGTFYIGFLANFGQGFYDDGIQANDLGYRSVEFYNSANTFLFGISYNQFNGPFGREPNTAPMHLDSGSGQFQALEGAPASFAQDGVTHLIVLKFDLSATAAADSLSVYLDPTTNDEPVIPSASVFGTDITLGAIGGFTIFGGSGQGPVLDEMRVGTTFIDALPEFPLPGDTNGDDLVDMTDYLAIIQHMNLTGQTTAAGDVTGDGRVDLRDLHLWRVNRTDISLGASTGDVSAPEPGTMVLLAMCVALRSLRRRRLRAPFAFHSVRS
jgi:hypothetical protein